ncbi:hypothetical protein U1Q18_043082 [Sarracenia purpurea var. burkii]
MVPGLRDSNEWHSSHSWTKGLGPHQGGQGVGRNELETFPSMHIRSKFYNPGKAFLEQSIAKEKLHVEIQKGKRDLHPFNSLESWMKIVTESNNFMWFPNTTVNGYSSATAKIP